MPFFRTLTISLILLLFITITLYAQRPLPETVYDSVNHRSVFVFSDQLHSGLNDNEARFAATHYSKGDYLHAAMMESWGNWASSSDGKRNITDVVAALVELVKMAV